MQWRAATIALTIALAAEATSAGAVLAAWTQPAVLDPTLGQGAPGGSVQIAGDTAFAAWTGAAGSFVAVGRAGGPLGKPQRLSAFDLENRNVTRLAVDQRGDAVVAWVTDMPGGPSPSKPRPDPQTLFVSYRRAGARFGPARIVARHAGDAAVAMDARGDATIVWEQVTRRGKSTGIAAVERGANGRYGLAQRVAGGNVQMPAVAVNARDQAVLVWQVLPAGLLLASTRGPHGSFGTPMQVASGQRPGSDTTVGLDNSGTARVAWEGPFDVTHLNSTPPVNVATIRVGSRRLGAVRRLGTASLVQVGGSLLQLAVNAGGAAIVAWTAGSGYAGPFTIMVARSRPGHPFGAPTAIRNGSGEGNFDSAIGPTGDAIVAYEAVFGVVDVVTSDGPTGPFGQPQQISSPEDAAVEPLAAIGRHGSAIAIWEDLGPTDPSKPPVPPSLLYATSR